MSPLLRPHTAQIKLKLRYRASLELPPRVTHFISAVHSDICLVDMAKKLSFYDQYRKVCSN